MPDTADFYLDKSLPLLPRGALCGPATGRAHQGSHLFPRGQTLVRSWTWSTGDIIRDHHIEALHLIIRADQFDTVHITRERFALSPMHRYSTEHG